MDGSQGLSIRDTVLLRLDEVGSATSTEMLVWVSDKRADGLSTLGRMVADGDIRRTGWQKKTGQALWQSAMSTSTPDRQPDT